MKKRLFNGPQNTQSLSTHASIHPATVGGVTLWVPFDPSRALRFSVQQLDHCQAPIHPPNPAQKPGPSVPPTTTLRPQPLNLLDAGAPHSPLPPINQRQWKQMEPPLPSSPPPLLVQKKNGARKRLEGAQHSITKGTTRSILQPSLPLVWIPELSTTPSSPGHRVSVQKEFTSLATRFPVYYGCVEPSRLVKPSRCGNTECW